jgi:hypothetical protein
VNVKDGFVDGFELGSIEIIGDEFFFQGLKQTLIVRYD